jgi:hypothetical protein
MTALAQPATRFADPLEVFVARCEARAILFELGEFDLHEAVDPLYAAALSTALIERLGNDEVQALIADAFGFQRIPRGESTFAQACRLADEEYARKPSSRPRAEPLPVSIEEAATWLRFYASDPPRFEAWLMEHSEQQRGAILDFLDKKKAKR